MDFVNTLNGYLWGTVFLILVIGLAIFYTVALKFPQVRLFKEMMGSLSKGRASESGLTPFQSFAMALGGRIGTGTIAGVATAIALGGPGAVFWMWIYALLGVPLAIVESSLAQLWKERIEGEYKGGPSYYLRKTPLPWLGAYVAYAGIIGYGFTGPVVQSFTITDSFVNAFHIPAIVTGIILAVLFGVIVIGGMRRIGSIAGYVVPIMAIAYLAVTIVVLLVNITRIPSMFALIFKSAFHMEAMYAGIFGAAINWGIRRAVYSSEAGMGTGANAAASAETSHPVKQGLAQGFSVYNTLIVCTCTALIILCTGMYNVYDASYAPIVENLPGVDVGAGYVQAAINTITGSTNIGSIFVAIATFFFAFTTLLSFGFYAAVGLAMVFKKTKYLKQIILGVTMLQMVSIILGGVWKSDLAWAIADVGVGSAAWINLLGLLCLIKPMLKLMKDYDRQRDKGLDPVYDPANNDIGGDELWTEIVDKHYKERNEANNVATNTNKKELGLKL
ncbi:MAG: alanine:cation symporter family protein [Clostridiales bacterium]|nr:alanine:cation symporter family protein [Clostridiales bacterium]